MQSERERKLAELSFHNQRERDRQGMSEASYLARYSNKKWYCITAATRERIQAWLERRANGGKVLDYCCGCGETSIACAAAGGSVYSLDISEDSVRTTRAKLVAAGFGANSHALVMDAEQTGFPDGFFDAVVCTGVLHHLDLDRAYAELSRILKPGGAILCLEALGHNPLIAVYRKFTPRLRTSWEAQHILTIPQIKGSATYFKDVSLEHHYLLSILAVPFRSTPLFPSLLRFLTFVDRQLFRLPFVRAMSWQVLFELRTPKPRVRVSHA